MKTITLSRVALDANILICLQYTYDDSITQNLQQLPFVFWSDGKKLYFGNDKVPYKLYDDNEKNCLTDIKDEKGDRGGFWLSADEQESFSTISSNVWKSKITGGIEGKGSLYKISNNKYAFVVYETSWGGKLENNLVIITTSDNCNTIYYGKGKKRMNLVK